MDGVRRGGSNGGSGGALVPPTAAGPIEPLLSLLYNFLLWMHRGFYIFTIITDDTRSIITLKMTPTYLALLFRDSYISTTFASVARYGGMTSWHPVSSGCEMSFMPLISSFLLPFRQLGPAAPPTARWTPLVSFFFYL